MGKRVIVPLFVLLIAFAFPATALAGSFTLHPSGFGEKSRANWKGQAGLPDGGGGSSPSSNQALYFQKMTATETFAAGVAVFKFDPFPVSQLTGLEFWWRTDGWCGAGAPRFNIRIEMTGGGTQTFFIGCQGMAPGATAVAPNGMTFEQRSIGAPFAKACCQVGGGLPDGTIVGLAMIFDEGTTQFGLPLGPGFVYLDDIKVSTTSPNGTKTWHSASDNSNSAAAPSVIGPSVAFADELTDVLALLGSMFPDVPITAWTLYPDVELADLVPLTIGTP